MKKIVFITFLIVLSLQNNYAQRSRRQYNPEEMIKKQIEKLDNKLELTNTQETKIKKIYTDFYSQLTKNKQLKREERVNRLKELHKKIEIELTQSQKEKYIKMIQAQEDQLKNRSRNIQGQNKHPQRSYNRKSSKRSSRNRK